MAVNHLTGKDHSPSGRSPGLRVSIPSSLHPGLSSGEDVSYRDVSNFYYLLIYVYYILYCPIYFCLQQRQVQSLNTPVVSLQTPGISTYTMGSFAPQDFSLNSDVMGLAWNHSNISNIQQTTR